MQGDAGNVAEGIVMRQDSTPEQPALLVERSAGVATLTLNRPGARNALSSTLIHALRGAMRELDEDNDVDVIVLTGADPAFCAGLDLKEMGAGGANLEMGSSPDGIEPAAPWPAIGKPIIGAINGVAVTGGLEVALHCDILVASERAAFADTHVRVGVLPGWGMSVLLPRAVGTRLARLMSLTGDFLSAEQALRAGLVTEVVPHEELLARARRVADAIVANDRTAVHALLATYRRIEADLDAPGFRTEAAASRAWLDRSFDPTAVEQRRAAVMDRGRTQAGRLGF